ncbi:hypothetical protein PESHB5_03710 [Pediococcus parvulus]
MRTFQKGKLSVIVPCYNVEEFIRECLDSLVNQTYKNIEVIMVDDGSPDNTGTILDEYDKAYTNFHAIHTPNGGLSAARNSGLPYVNGEYMTFVDSDDVVIKDAYERLIGSLMQTGSDMASGFVQRFNSRRVYSSGLHKKAIPETILRTNINESPFLVYDTTAWNKVYRSTLFLDNNLHFPVGLTYEDIPVSMQLHLLAKSVDVIAEPVYLWRVRESSNQSITQKRESLKLFNDRTQTVKMAQITIKKMGGSQELRKAFNFKVLDLDISMYLDSFQSANEETLFKFQKAVYKFLRDYDLDDIKKLDIRKQIQYNAILQGNFVDFKRFGFEKQNVGQIKIAKNGNYTYVNKSIKKGLCDQITLDNALSFKTSISNIEKVQNKVVIDGTVKVISSAKLPKMNDKINGLLVNTTNNKQISIDFQQIQKRTRDSFFLKKTPTGFKITFDINEAEKQIGSGKWKVKLILVSENIELEDYLSGPRKMKKLILEPVDQKYYFVTNYFNRRWQLLFNVIDKRENNTVNRNWIQDIAIYEDSVRITAYIDQKIYNPILNYNTETKISSASTVLKTEENKNGFYKYFFEWKLSNLLTDTVLAGQISLNDKNSNALLDYSFERATRIKTLTTQNGINININKQQNTISLFLYKSILSVEKIKVDPSGEINLYFRDPIIKNIDLGSMTITLESDDQKNSYKKYTKIFKDISNEYKASISLFDENDKAKILKGNYNIYLNVLVDNKNYKYILTANQYKDRNLGQVSKALFESDVQVNAEGLIKIKMVQKWTNPDRTAIRRAFNYSLLYPLMRLLPLQKKTVVFESLWGAYLNDNPEAIYDYWKKNYPNYKFVWSFKDLAIPDDEDIIAVRKYSFKYWYYLARAKYFIENTNFPNQYAKRKGQIEVQTLHGTFMKTMGFDEPQFRKGSVITQRNFMKRNARWDYLISPSKYMDEVTAHAFDYHKKVLPVGFPRNDVLINGNKKPYIDKLKQKMGLPFNKKVILYAPTFRQNGVVDLELDIKKLQDKLSDDYVLLVRLHYLVANAVDLHKFSGFALDMSSYDSIEELYLVSDVLITDYSSVMFDYGYLKRPMIFFAYDLDWYLDSHNRGVYLDYVNTVPGPVFKSTDQIAVQLTNFNDLKVKYHDQLGEFYDRFCLYGRDGKAAEHTVQTILKNKSLAYKQDYEHGLILTKFTHFLGLTDLKSDLFNYLGQHTSRKNTIIFESFKGQSYSDSPRAIYEYMKQKNYSYKLLWNIDRSQKKYFEDHQIPYVIKDSYKGILTKARAKYWFTNSQMTKNWKKPHGMKLVQTSKGTPIKKVGADVMTDFVPGKTITKYQQDQVFDARKWDYLVAGNDFGAQVLQNAYRKETNQMVKSGLPKNDQLLAISQKRKSQIINDLSIQKKHPIILYAPTWRDDEALNVDKYITTLRLNIEQVIKTLPDSAILLVRFHRLVAENRPDLSMYGSKVLDVTDYSDVTDILAITDILITDYSSIAFDFMNLKRPIIFFADDLDRYSQQIRGLYLDYHEDLPGYFASTTGKVIDYLTQLIQNPLLPDNFESCYEKYCSWENGNSTEKLLKVVFEQKKYMVKQVTSNLVGKKAVIEDGSQLWNQVYNGRKTRLIKNIDDQKKRYIVLKVAGLVDPVREKTTGRMFAELKIENIKVWVALSDLQSVK